MSVIARFYVQSVIAQPGTTANEVTLGAVCRGAHNAEWSSATPYGSIKMGIRNDAAWEQFQQGQEYEVIFRPVNDKPAPGDGHPVNEFVTNQGYVICGDCGTYPTILDGQYGPTVDKRDQLDWSNHEKMFGSSPE